MIIYIAGPYTAPTRKEITQNIARAREIAIEVWKTGNIAICPHLNTAHFDVNWPEAPKSVWIEGDFAILLRCDAILMMPGWDKSQGAREEALFASAHNIPIYYYPDIPPMHPIELRTPVQAHAFMRELMKMYRMHLSKNMDYSPANILGTGEIGLAARIWDKVARLLNLTGFDLEVDFVGFSEPAKPTHESVSDTLLDLAVYSVIWRLLMNDEWGV